MAFERKGDAVEHSEVERGSLVDRSGTRVVRDRLRSVFNRRLCRACSSPDEAFESSGNGSASACSKASAKMTTSFEPPASRSASIARFQSAASSSHRSGVRPERANTLARSNPAARRSCAKTSAYVSSGMFLFAPATTFTRPRCAYPGSRGLWRCQILRLAERWLAERRGPAPRLPNAMRAR